MRKRAVLLAVIVASALLYLHLLRIDAVNGWLPVLDFLSTMAALFALYFAGFKLVDNWKWVAVGAVVFRLILLPAGLPSGAASSTKLELLKQDIASREVTYERFQLFDDDIWRYLWDGHVSASGVNPYRYAPSDPALDSALGPNPIWTDIRENVSYPSVPTIYPPLAQAFFWLCDRIAPGSLLIMKSLLTLLDLSAACLLGLTLRATGGNPAWSLLYAWNPLVVKVYAGSGHVDALAVALLMLMAYLLVKGAPALAAIALGLAILAKLTPAVLLPFFWRRAGSRNLAIILAVILIGYVPFLSAGTHLFGGLFGFAREWQFNAGIYAIFRWMSDPLVAKGACGLLLAFVLWRVWRGEPQTTAAEAAPALGWLVVLSPAIMPWYTTWALPFAILARQRVWIVWTGIVCLAFFVMVDGRERPWILAIEYVSLACIWILDLHLKQRKTTK